MNAHGYLRLFALSLLISSQLTAQQDASAEGKVAALIALGDSTSEADNHYQNARPLYKEALDLDPFNPVANHKYGRAFLGDYFRGKASADFLDSAIVYENIARTLDPHYVNAYWNEVMSYRQKWRHGMTRKVLIEALEHMPDNPEILMLAGRNYFDTGNPGLALPYLEKSIELGGEDAPGVSYRFAGWCWFYLEDHEKQLEYFNRFREIDPKSLMGIAGQVHSYTGMQDYEKATELAIQIKKENPDYDYPASLEAYIGETLLFGMQFDEAIPYYETALQLDSLSRNLFATRAVTTTLGYLYLQDGREKLGKELLKKTIARRLNDWQEMPERWEYSFDIASAYAASGDMNNAYQWLYTSVLTGYPGHLWSRDPIFSKCHDVASFNQLINQARIRVNAEYEQSKKSPLHTNLKP